MRDEKILRKGTAEHPRPSGHEGDVHGTAGAKKVPNETHAAEPLIGFGKPPVRPREVQ